MSDEQPTHADPSEYIPRTDAGARKLIDRIDELNETLGDVASKIAVIEASSVTHKTMMQWVGGAALSIIVGAWVVTETFVDSAIRPVRTDVEAITTDIDILKKDNAAINREVREDIRELYKANRSKRRSPRLERDPENE